MKASINRRSREETRRRGDAETRRLTAAAASFVTYSSSCTAMTLLILSASLHLFLRVPASPRQSTNPPLRAKPEPTCPPAPALCNAQGRGGVLPCPYAFVARHPKADSPTARATHPLSKRTGA